MQTLFDQKVKRIQVVGSSCAGKTIFAKRLSQVLKVPHIELDSLHWEPNWKEADTEIFKTRVAQAIAHKEWIVDGQYTGKIGNLVADQVNIVIWLDLSLMTILKRFFIRSFRRSWSGEVLWNGCQETLRNSIFKKDSLLMWILNTHRARRTKYASQYLKSKEGVAVIRLTSPRQVEEFLGRYE